jgi:hypothetical protein
MVTLSGLESDESVHGGYLPGCTGVCPAAPLEITLSLAVTVGFLLEGVKGFASNKRISVEPGSLMSYRAEAESGAWSR